MRRKNKKKGRIFRFEILGNERNDVSGYRRQRKSQKSVGNQKNYDCVMLWALEI